MSTPPPPPGYGYVPGPPSGFSREQVRAQRRMAEAQARAMRQQVRMAQRGYRLQRRAYQRSVVGPILLLFIGVVLLFGLTGHLDLSHVLAWYSRWWPAILIAAGALLLLEWALDQHLAQRPDRGQGIPFGFGQRVMGPGVGILLLLLACAGWSLGWFNAEGRRQAHGFADQFGFQRLLSQEYEWDDSTQSALRAGAPLTIHNPRGDVSISGSSADGQVHVAVHKKVYAWQQSSADGLRDQITPHFSDADGGLLLDVPAVSGAEADLTVEVPAKTGLTVRTDHGDTSVSNLGGAVMLFSKHGDVTLDGVNGSVNAHINGDGATVSAQKITGSVRVQGRTGDLHFADIDGPLTLEGDFFGSTHIEHVSDAVVFQTSRTHFETAHLPGTLDLDGGPDFQVQGVAGPLVLNTRNRNITIDDITGSAQITNRNGAVAVTASAPLGSLQITNERGAVDLALPEKAGFHVLADARNGEVENDFGLSAQSGGKTQSLNATIAGGGPDIRITTSDGGITLRKKVASDAGNLKPPPKPPSPPPPPGKHLRGGAPAFERM